MAASSHGSLAAVTSRRILRHLDYVVVCLNLRPYFKADLGFELQVIVLRGALLGCSQWLTRLSQWLARLNNLDWLILRRTGRSLNRCIGGAIRMLTLLPVFFCSTALIDFIRFAL